VRKRDGKIKITQKDALLWWNWLSQFTAVFSAHGLVALFTVFPTYRIHGATVHHFNGTPVK
jgi:hypothetical protein